MILLLPTRAAEQNNGARVSRRTVSHSESTTHTSDCDSMLREINGSFNTLPCDDLTITFHMISIGFKKVEINFWSASDLVRRLRTFPLLVVSSEHYSAHCPREQRTASFSSLEWSSYFIMT